MECEEAPFPPGFNNSKDGIVSVLPGLLFFGIYPADSDVLRWDPSHGPASEMGNTAIYEYPMHRLTYMVWEKCGYDGVFDAVGLNTNNYLTKPPGTLTDPLSTPGRHDISLAPPTQLSPPVGLPLSQPPDVHVHVGKHHWIGGLEPTELFPPVVEEER